jgi:hypothetical protein
VPDDARLPGSEAAERAGLGRFLARLGDATLAATGGLDDAGSWAAGAAKDVATDTGRAAWNGVTSGVGSKVEELRGAAHYVKELNPATHLARLQNTAVDWYRQRSNCTPPEAAPPPLPERRIPVVVAGLGSSGAGDSVDALDTTGLGYDPEDKKRFSYRGGTADENPYDPRDTTDDLRDSARRLGELLERVAREHPGVPVDLIAHSQGGIVSRAFLAYEYEAKRARLPKIANLAGHDGRHHGR